MYAQIMFWNSYFRDFPSAEEPWGQAIWGLPAASGWPSFALPKCKVLSNLGRSRESCRYQPFMELLEGFGVRVSCRETDPVLEHTYPSSQLWVRMMRNGPTSVGPARIFSLTSSLTRFGRPAVIFIDIARTHTEYTENIHFNFCFSFAL